MLSLNIAVEIICKSNALSWSNVHFFFLTLVVLEELFPCIICENLFSC